MFFCISLSLSVVSAGVVTGTTFADIQNEIDNPLNGGTVDLIGGITYTGSGNTIRIQNQNGLIIQDHLQQIKLF